MVIIMQGYDEKLAREYAQEQELYFKSHKDITRKLLYKVLPRINGKTILDAGCGFGFDLKILLRKGAKVYGVDASKTMIKIAREINPEIKNIFVASFTKTKLQKNLFDIVISRFAFHYAPNPESIFKEMNRILKPNGLLIFVVPSVIKDYTEKVEKTNENSYFKQKMLPVSLYNKKICLSFPSHTLTDWLSSYNLKHFDLIKIIEDNSAEHDTKKRLKIPSFVIYVMKKR